MTNTFKSGFFLSLFLVVGSAGFCETITLDQVVEFADSNASNLELFDQKIRLQKKPTGTIAGYSRYKDLPNALSDAGSFVIGNTLFVGGGTLLSGSPNDIVYRTSTDAPIHLTTWETSFSLPVSGARPEFVRVDKRLYVFVNRQCFSTIFSNALPTTVSWREEVSLPAGYVFNRVINIDQWLFAFPNNASSDILRAQILPNGSISSWQDGGTLPMPLINYGVGRNGNAIFLIGGMDNTSAPRREVYKTMWDTTAVLDAWTAQVQLPRGLTSPLIANRETIYVVGGHNGTEYERRTLFSNLNDQGDILAWKDDFSIKTPPDGGFSATVGDKVFIGVGKVGTPSKIIYAAQFLESQSVSALTQITNRIATVVDGVPSGIIRFKHRIYTTYATIALFASAQIVDDLSQLVWRGEPAGTLPAMFGLFTDGNHLYGASRGDLSTWQIYHIKVNNNGVFVGGDLVASLGAYVAFQNRDPLIWIANGRLYVGGGSSSTSVTRSDIRSAEILPDGTLGTFRNENSFPYAVNGSGISVVKNRIYLVGGWSSSSPTVFVNHKEVYSTQFGADGVIESSWRRESDLPSVLYMTEGGSSVQPAQRSDFKVISNGDTVTIYNAILQSCVFTNGLCNVARPSLYQSTINSDTTLSAWSANETFPREPWQAAACEVEGRYYFHISLATSRTSTTPIPNEVFKKNAPLTVKDGMLRQVVDVGSGKNINNVSWVSRVNGGSTLGATVSLSNNPGVAFSSEQPAFNGVTIDQEARFVSNKFKFVTADRTTEGPILESLTVDYKTSDVNVDSFSITKPTGLARLTEGLVFRLTSNEPISGKLKVLGGNQRLIRVIPFDYPPGVWDLKWDGRDESGLMSFADIFTCVFDTTLGGQKISVGAIP